MNNKEIVYQNKINKRVIKLRDKLEKVENQITSDLRKIHDECPHYHLYHTNHGNTGSWDKDDYYWRVYYCDDCMTTWTTSQDYESTKKYNQSIDRTYNKSEKVLDIKKYWRV